MKRIGLIVLAALLTFACPVLAGPRAETQNTHARRHHHRHHRHHAKHVHQLATHARLGAGHVEKMR